MLTYTEYIYIYIKHIYERDYYVQDIFWADILSDIVHKIIERERERGVAIVYRVR